MKTLLIINPYSRSGKSASLSEKCIKYLNSRSFDFETAYLKNFNDAYELSKDANIKNYDNIVAVGGDGTINKVINGFYDTTGKRISDSCFGVIYTGTSPDFCKSYNIPVDIYKSCEAIINQKTIDIPVGMIKYRNRNSVAGAYGNDEMSKYFACCANVGLGAMLAQKANSGIRKYMGDFLGTLLSLIQLLISYRGKNYHIVMDDEHKNLSNVFNISVGITNYIASGIQVAADTNRDYSQLYVMTVSNIKISKIYQLLKQVYSGKNQPDSDIFKLEYAKAVSICGESLLPDVEFDGDPAGYLPCSIRIAKDKLKVLTTYDLI